MPVPYKCPRSRRVDCCIDLLCIDVEEVGEWTVVMIRFDAGTVEIKE
jgi:hypothetical protein